MAKTTTWLVPLVLLAGCKDGLQDSSAPAAARVTWLRNIGGTDASAVAVAATGAAKVAVASLIQQGGDFGEGDVQPENSETLLVLAHYGANGALEWANTVAGPFDEHTRVWLGADGEGTLVVALDDFLGTLNLLDDELAAPLLLGVSASSGHFLWAHSLYSDAETLALTDAAIAPNGHIVLAMTSRALVDSEGTPLDAPGMPVAGVLRLADDREQVFYYTVQGDVGSSSGRLGLGPDGETVFSWLSHQEDTPNPTAMVRRVDRDGNLSWGSSLGGNFTHHPPAVSVDAHGSVYAAGHFTYGDMSDGDLESLVVARMAKGTGDVLWTRRFGNASSSPAAGAILSVGDTAVLVGDASGHLAFDERQLPASDVRMFYASALQHEDGSAVWLRHSESAGDVTLHSGSVRGKTIAVGGVFYRDDSPTRHELFFIVLEAP